MSKKGAIIIEGHVQGLANTRALGEAGIPVIVVDKNTCVASSSIYCKGFFKCPDYKSEAFIDFLINLGISENLQGWVLIPSNDHAVYNISKNLNRISEIYKTTIPEINTIELIYNKSNLLSLADSLNIPIPKTYYFSSVDIPNKFELKFPVLTKGKQGLDFYKSLGKKAYLALNAKELLIQLALIKNKFSLENTFSQELIRFDGTNKTISLAAFCVNGEIMAYWMGAKLREHPFQFGTATFTESVMESQCLNSSITILKALKYTGVCEVEFLKDPKDNKFKLIEINARTWLWVGHAISNGVNFPLYIYNYLNNLPNDYNKEYEVGLKWKNPISDMVFTTIGLIKKNLKYTDIKTNNKGNVINALWVKEDKKPYFKYILLMINFLKNR